MNNKVRSQRFAFLSFVQTPLQLYLLFFLSFTSFVSTDVIAQCSTLVALHTTSPQNGSICQGALTIDITATGFDSLNALQFSVSWDPDQLDFSSASFISPGGGVPTIGDTPDLTDMGQLTYVWFDPDTMSEFDGVSLPDNTVLGTLNFTSSGGGGIAQVWIGDTPTAANFTGSDYCEAATVNTTDVNVGLGGEEPVDLDDLFRSGSPVLKPGGPLK